MIFDRKSASNKKKKEKLKTIQSKKKSNLKKVRNNKINEIKKAIT